MTVYTPARAVANQLAGKWRTKRGAMKDRWYEVRGYQAMFDQVRFEHLPRRSPGFIPQLTSLCRAALVQARADVRASHEKKVPRHATPFDKETEERIRPLVVNVFEYLKPLTKSAYDAYLVVKVINTLFERTLGFNIENPLDHERVVRLGMDIYAEQSKQLDEEEKRERAPRPAPRPAKKPKQAPTPSGENHMYG